MLWGEGGVAWSPLPGLSAPPPPATICLQSSPLYSVARLALLHHLGLLQQLLQTELTSACGCMCLSPSPPLLCCFCRWASPTLCFAHRPPPSSLPPFPVLPALPAEPLLPIFASRPRSQGSFCLFAYPAQVPWCLLVLPALPWPLLLVPVGFLP